MKQSFRSLLLGLAVAVTVGGVAWAQEDDITAIIEAAGEEQQQAEQAETVEAAEQEQPTAPVKEAPKGFDEVIVTAQKRAQDVRDVPISISVVDSEEIKQRNIENFNDLADVVPNVQIAATPTVSFIYFRGMGSGLNRGFETSVGVFDDGMYMGRPSFFSNGFIDIGHVEVLRGPQGTLFGKNTVAGALQLNSVVPSPEFEAYGDFMFGEREHKRARIGVNVPVWDDKLMIRASFARDLRDGEVYNTTLDRYEGDSDYTDYMLRLRFQPTNWLDLNFKVRYADVHQDGNGSAELIFADEDNGGLFPLFDPEVEDTPNWQTSLDHPGYVYRDTWYYMGQADISFGDALLTLVGTHAEYDEYNESDVDFTPVPGLVARFPEDYNQQSLEVRWLSPESDLLEYVVGLYYFQSTVNVLTVVDALPLGLSDVSGLLLPPALADTIGGLLPNLGEMPVEQQLDWFDQTTRSYAAFGQFTMHMTERLDLLLGFRVSYERKNLDYRQEFTNTKLFFTQVAGFEEFDERGIIKTETDFSPKVSILYAVSDEIKAYGTVARGFKSGGFNESSANAEEIEFDAEVAVTFEGGIKGRFLGGFGNFAFGGFWTEFDDLQVSTYNGARFIVSNAARAVTRGLEWELGLILGEGLIVGTNGGFTRAYYREYRNGPCQATDERETCDLTGFTLNSAPKWNGSLFAHYEFSVLQFMKAFVSMDGIYVGETKSADHDPIDNRGFYAQWNGRVGFKDPEDRWSFTVYGRNLLDRKIILGSGDSPLWAGTHFGSLMPGRTIDAEFRINF